MLLKDIKLFEGNNIDYYRVVLMFIKYVKK